MKGARQLSAPTEAWLRSRIPEFGKLRDKAIAAGLVDPVLPMTEDQMKQVQAVSARVRRRLSVSAGSPVRSSKKEVANEG